MFDCAVSFLLPTRMNSGVPFGLSCCAMTWSSELPIGTALNLYAVSKLNGSVPLGVTGGYVKPDPARFKWGSFACPRPAADAPEPRLFCVHSFIARMPRGIRILLAYGARPARFVAMRSLAARAPCDFAGKNFVVMQP